MPLGVLALVSLAAAANLAGAVAGPSCRTSDARVEGFIAAKARELGGSEYCQFRRYETMSDVDGDGVDDFVVVFGIEGRNGGGNDITQFLAVFGSRAAWKPRVVECGGRGTRLVDEIEGASDGIVVMTASVYREKDPMCCPSGETRIAFRIDGEKLVEVPAPAPPRE